MTRFHRLLPVLVAVLRAASLSAQVDRGHLTSGGLAITNVTVIPMTGLSAHAGFIPEGRADDPSNSISFNFRIATPGVAC